METTKPKILDDLIALRDKVGGLVAKKGMTPFPVKSAKDLMLKLRNAADELGMPVAGAVVNQQVSHLPPVEFKKRDGSTATGIGAHVIATVRFVSSDGSSMDFVGSGHGTSEDDKAGGKASTYAWKDAVIKGLSLPDDEMVDTDDDSVPVTPKKNAFTFGKKN